MSAGEGGAVGDGGGDGGVGGWAGTGGWASPLGGQGEPSGPRSFCGNVRVVIRRWTGSNLQRGLEQGKREHCGGGEFLAGGLAAVLPGAGREVLDQRTKTVPQLVVIGDLAHRAVDHSAGVVHGVVERRAGIDHTV